YCKQRTMLPAPPGVLFLTWLFWVVVFFDM
ncbi:MAG: hypothetical protein ACI8R9_002322, partial [Paraglaciecola sp.]